MANVFKAPRGTQDILPDRTAKIQNIESILLNIGKSFGYREIRTPVFENTEVFRRGVGGTTDVVQKEMYSFEDKGGRNITLRPEGTAGVIRSVIEHGLLNDALPIKLCYLISCYRYEKPQAGRLREFHQFGCECIGSLSPSADAQLIIMGRQIFDFFGIDGISLEINSIGCSKCRAEYHKALKEYFAKYTESLCETCRTRLEKNPMRIFDCKSPECKKIAESAPKITDFLCEECSEHFSKVKEYLACAGIEYTVNPCIVRGLDYYTRTVFEFISSEIGAQGTVLGGGRYDGLVEELGGKPAPALGFAMGIERLFLLLEAQGINVGRDESPDIYFANIDENAMKTALSLASDLTADGYSAEVNLMDRSLKAQLKYANKTNTKFTAVIGEEDLEKGTVGVKNMKDGTVTECRISGFAEDFENLMISEIMEGISLPDFEDNKE